MGLDGACYSDIGGRAVNEDATLWARLEGGLFIGAVADGLGGHGGGDQASQAALSCLEKEGGLLAPMTEEGARSVLERMNRAVLARQTEGMRMKTTLAMAAVRGNQALLIHIGDSRAYHFRQGKILYQSMDHSVSQMAVLAGEITQEEIRFHEDRNRVLRVLGTDEPLKPQIKAAELVKGDALLLCSDGFWEYILEDEMLSALARSQGAKDWLRRMTGRVNSAAPEDQDNNSAVAIRLI